MRRRVRFPHVFLCSSHLFRSKPSSLSLFSSGRAHFRFKSSLFVLKLAPFPLVFHTCFRFEASSFVSSLSPLSSGPASFVSSHSVLFQLLGFVSNHLSSFQSKLLAWRECRDLFIFRASFRFEAFSFVSSLFLLKSGPASFVSSHPFSFQRLCFVSARKLRSIICEGALKMSVTTACSHLRSLAVTCGHLRSLAVTCGHLRSPAVTCCSGRLRSLAVSCGRSSDCK